MPTNFDHQQPLNLLGFCKSAPMEQHGGHQRPANQHGRPLSPASPKAPIEAKSERLG